jgi:sugar lactone lactonase YvrE
MKTGMSALTIQTIGTRISKWGEGPIWWNDRLIYVDIEGHTLVALDPETGDEHTWNVGERIGTVVPRSNGGYLYAGDTGIIAFDPETGAKQELADPEPEKRATNRFNDGKCDPSGRFWAGTISLVKNIGDANLYMLDTDATLHLKVDEVTNSNGICWNADATKLYYIDTMTKQIRAYDYDNASGGICNASIAVDTAERGYDTSPDGMTIDADGNLWVAFCHGGCVTCFDPTTGKELRKVDLPCVETTACAFGGPKLDRLFVTTGIHSTKEEADAGKVFVIDGLGVRGVPAFAYQG